MDVTYTVAREIVRRATEPGWHFGTYYMDDTRIVETATHFVFTVGAREFFIAGDRSFATGGATPAVEKQTGDLHWLASASVATDPTITVRPIDPRRASGHL